MDIGTVIKRGVYNEHYRLRGSYRREFPRTPSVFAWHSVTNAIWLAARASWFAWREAL